MARFKVAVQRPTNVTYALGGGGYDYEMEYLSTIDAEIVEFEASSEGEFIEQVKDCDALIAQGRQGHGEHHREPAKLQDNRARQRRRGHRGRRRGHRPQHPGHQRA